MRSGPVQIRILFAALLALLLAVRSLAPAGFMPTFDHGSLTIVECPDAQPSTAMAPMAHHDHRQHEKRHQPCPYAAASGLNALGAHFGPQFDVLILAAALMLGRALILPVRSDLRVRPPSRGPPFRA
jgi:hypothetical protein